MRERERRGIFSVFHHWNAGQQQLNRERRQSIQDLWINGLKNLKYYERDLSCIKHHFPYKVHRKKVYIKNFEIALTKRILKSSFKPKMLYVKYFSILLYSLAHRGRRSYASVQHSSQVFARPCISNIPKNSSPCWPLKWVDDLLQPFQF